MNSDHSKVKVQQSKLDRYKHNWHLLRRKEDCHTHDLKLRYECQHQNCNKPFLCNSIECLESHFHDDVLTIKRFSRDNLTEKLKQAELSIERNQRHFTECSQMKNILDGYKRSLVDLFSALEEMKVESDKLLQEQQAGGLTLDFLMKVDRLNQMDTKISEDITNLKSKFLGPSEPPLLSHHVTSFLEKQIPNFSWDNALLIWSCFKPEEKLPETLQNKSNLLFLFLGDKINIGSYVTTPYPSLTQKTKKAPKSFIFFQEDSNSNSFAKFLADESADSHIQITQKLLISHGNRPASGEGIQSFGKNLDRISFYLPSQSYKRVQEMNSSEEKEPFSGHMKLQQLLIYQLGQ